MDHHESSTKDAAVGFLAARGNYDSLDQLRAAKQSTTSRPVIKLGIPVSELLDFLVGQAAEQGYSQTELHQLFAERIHNYFTQDE